MSLPIIVGIARDVNEWRVILTAPGVSGAIALLNEAGGLLKAAS